MSMFNELHVVLSCPACGQSAERTIQFKFGERWQHEYHLGDTVRWGVNEVGEPGLQECASGV